MALRENVLIAFRDWNRFFAVLKEIARGRTDNGRPLAAETARQKARDVLIECGYSWGADDD